MTTRSPANQNTLASKLGVPTHVSPLLRKLRQHGILNPESMIAAAVARGCRHYANIQTTQSRPSLAPDISDAELTTALLSPANPYDPMLIRVGAQLLSKTGAKEVPSCKPRELALLAKQERSQTVLRYIAQAGSKTEPDSPFWKELLSEIQKLQKGEPQERNPNPPPGVLPHQSRFRSETGLVNPRNPVPKIRWLRAANTQGTT